MLLKLQTIHSRLILVFQTKELLWYRETVQSTGFIKELVQSKILKKSDLKDWQYLVPVMDYHMQRAMLRTGCVEVEDKQLKLKLQNRETLSSDKLVREAAIESMKLLSRYSGKSIFNLDDSKKEAVRLLITTTLFLLLLLIIIILIAAII